MRERYCKVCKGWHQLDAWPHNCMPEPVWNRSALPAPMFVRDTMEEGVQSMVDGKIYTSKAKLRASYRAHGVTEVGNEKSIIDPPLKPKPKTDRKAVRAAAARALSKAGFGA
jgi:hypothetical protein